MIASSSRLALVGALLVLTGAGAVAQSASAPAAPSASQPRTAIAVPPQTAAEAASKAIPRSDVGTVVKTGPTAADKTREATGSNKHHARRAHGAASAASAASSADGR